MIFNDLYKYTYYRLTHAMLKNGWRKPTSHDRSFQAVESCVAANILTLSLIILYLFLGNLKIELIIGSAVIALFMGFFLIDNESYFDGVVYEQLDMKYKDEKNRVLKGYLVFLYIIFSNILFILTVIAVT